MALFFRSFLLFLIVITAAIFLLSKMFATSYITTLTWLIFGYFVILTTAFHYGLIVSSRGKPQQFVRYYMGATSFKLLIHLVVLIIYCLFHKSDAVRFIISFALFYFVFTAFEFTTVRRSLKK